MSISSIITYAQTDQVYYYYQGKKVFCETDSTSAVIVMKSDNLIKDKLNKKSFNILSEEKIGNRKTFKIKASSAINRNMLKNEFGA